MINPNLDIVKIEYFLLDDIIIKMNALNELYQDCPTLSNNNYVAETLSNIKVEYNHRHFELSEILSKY